MSFFVQVKSQRFNAVCSNTEATMTACCSQSITKTLFYNPSHSVVATIKYYKHLIPNLFHHKQRS